jgi:hypothetical protein
VLAAWQIFGRFFWIAASALGVGDVDGAPAFMEVVEQPASASVAAATRSSMRIWCPFRLGRQAVKA